MLFSITFYYLLLKYDAKWTCSICLITNIFVNLRGSRNNENYLQLQMKSNFIDISPRTERLYCQNEFGYLVRMWQTQDQLIYRLTSASNLQICHIMYYLYAGNLFHLLISQSEGMTSSSLSSLLATVSTVCLVKDDSGIGYLQRKKNIFIFCISCVFFVYIQFIQYTTNLGKIKYRISRNFSEDLILALLAKALQLAKIVYR